MSALCFYSATKSAEPIVGTASGSALFMDENDEVSLDVTEGIDYIRTTPKSPTYS